jgi:hypothetical protein
MAAEAVWPLRRRVEAWLPHVLRDLAIAAPAFALIGLLTTPVIEPVAEWSSARHFGMAQWLPLPDWTRTVLAVLLLAGRSGSGTSPTTACRSCGASTSPTTSTATSTLPPRCASTPARWR